MIMDSELCIFTMILGKSVMNWAKTLPGGGKSVSFSHISLAEARVHRIRNTYTNPTMSRNSASPSGFLISADTMSTRISSPTANQSTLRHSAGLAVLSGRNWIAARIRNRRFVTRRKRCFAFITAPPHPRRFCLRYPCRTGKAACYGKRCIPVSEPVPTGSGAGRRGR